MAVRQVSETDSLDKLRIEFNALAANDFGDISNLSSTLSATSVIEAVNEINSIAIAAAGFILSDGSNTQAVASGNTMLVTTGTGITATVSSEFCNGMILRLLFYDYPPAILSVDRCHCISRPVPEIQVDGAIAPVQRWR